MSLNQTVPRKYLVGDETGSNYPIVISSKGIGLGLKIRLRAFGWLGPTKIRQDSALHEMPIYLNWCTSHRCYYLDYPHSWNKTIECPSCLTERLNKVKTYRVHRRKPHP